MYQILIFPVDLKCPACKRRGVADAEHFTAEGRYTLTDLSDSFTMLMGSRTPGKAVVLCPCGADFHA